MIVGLHRLIQGVFALLQLMHTVPFLATGHTLIIEGWCLLRLLLLAHLLTLLILDISCLGLGALESLGEELALGVELNCACMRSGLETGGPVHLGSWVKLWVCKRRARTLSDGRQFFTLFLWQIRCLINATFLILLLHLYRYLLIDVFI